MAECVSEITERPLYPISSGDLGTTGPDLDKSLKSILNLAERWKAVALIDEADIFLETRAPRDVERNTLVSVFLRLLEYYSGILILTTNRVTFFDEAFQSRIHCPLRFGDLPKQSRQQIWKNFLAPLIGDGSACLSEDDFDALSDTPLNGRQIKNTVSTSASLAKYKGTVLDVEQLEQVSDARTTLCLRVQANTCARLCRSRPTSRLICRSRWMKTCRRSRSRCALVPAKMFAACFQAKHQRHTPEVRLRC